MVDNNRESVAWRSASVLTWVVSSSVVPVQETRIRLTCVFFFGRGRSDAVTLVMRPHTTHYTLHTTHNTQHRTQHTTQHTRHT